MTWYLYILECRDKTLYIGITRDIERRVGEHNRTNRCRYTRFRKPVKLMYKERCKNYSVALKREREVKKFSRKKKFALINKVSEDLSPTCRKRRVGSRSKNL